MECEELIDMEELGSIPVQYIRGKERFMGMDIVVDQRVLIPRPETRLLVEVTAGFCRGEGWKKPMILDVCTGSGIIPLGLTSLIKNCRVLGTDISTDALDVAQINLNLFDHNEKVELLESDMFKAFGPKDGGKFDAIVSNPPYVSKKDLEHLDEWVKAEPEIALYGGVEGMDHIETIVKDSVFYLKSGGFLALEVGYDQALKVKNCLMENGFDQVEGFRDFNGHERVITGWKNG